MKKLLAVLIGLLLMAGVASAQWTPVHTNQITVIWLEVTTLENGDPIPAGDSVAYEVFTRKLPDGTQQSIGRTTELTSTITIPDEGEWAVGIAAIRLCADGSETITEINWSTVNGAATPNPFSVIYRIPLSGVEGLSPQ